MAASPFSVGRVLTRLISRTGQVIRSVYYRYIGLSWVHFGRGVVIAGPIRCPGISGTISIGAHTFLGPNLTLAVAQGGKIEIGDNVSLNQGTILTARHRIQIGSGTRIGDNTSIRDSDHAVVSGHPIRSSGYEGDQVLIGANVWIGRQVTIMPGITIGDDSVIGAHSLVTHSIPPRVVAYGTPARIQRSRP